MSKTLNVIKVSGWFCQQAAADRPLDLKTVVHEGRVFAAESLNLHPEVPVENRINTLSLKKMWQAALRIAYHAHSKGFEGVVLPHEKYSERGKLIQREICEPLGRHYELDIRLQRGVYVLDEANVDSRVRTCLEQGVVRVLRVNSNVLSLKRAA